MFQIQKNRIILASHSAIRRQILEQAGLRYEILPASLDEENYHQTLKKQLERASSNKEITEKISQMALMLARDKARDVSGKIAEKNIQDLPFIIAADQILAAGKTVFSKPRSMEEARAHLRFLRGRAHDLYSTVTLWQNGVCLWTHLEIPRLVMRDFSDEFLDYYLAREGDALCHSVGAYRLEGLGAQLFSALKGDDKAVLGLPLLPLLAALREKGCLSA